MEILSVVIGYIVVGIIFSIVSGWFGAYDYTPKYDQVKPTTAKYTNIIIWPFFVLFIICLVLWDVIKFCFGWLDVLFNKVARVK